MTRKIQLILILILLIVLSAAFFLIAKKTDVFNFMASGSDRNFNTRWAENKLWDDGMSEVAIYESQRIVYGKARFYDYAYILVKETFNREFNVKTDDYDRNDLFDVIKVNKFAQIETHKYPYHYLTSLYFERDEPARVHKLTNSSQEWCGNTFKHINPEEDRYIYHYDSYWDNQGRGSMTLPGDVLFEDQLSYSLRTLNFRDGMTFEARVVESQITNQATDPEIYDAIFSISAATIDSEKLEYLSGTPAWMVEVKLAEDKTNIYWFEEAYPNIMLKMQAWDGRKMLLASRKRDDYWADE